MVGYVVQISIKFSVEINQSMKVVSCNEFSVKSLSVPLTSYKPKYNCCGSLYEPFASVKITFVAPS